MKIYVLSLGCAKNRVDSECLAGELKRAGHKLVDDVSLAEIGIVNTCGFIRPAVEESVSAILDLEQLKFEGKLKKIGVVGCLVNRYSKDLKNDIPAVDFWAESEDWGFVLKALGNEIPTERCRSILPSSSKFTRYLKISEGCNNRCTYCTIPSIRGELRSLPLKTIVSEAQQLVSNGARELCLVGQDLTVYGTDMSDKSSLIELLDALESSLPDNIWLRLLYLHPSRITTKLLERVAFGKQILPYLDVPIQHGDSRILKSMNRGISDEELLAIFTKAREINPDFALRTTCLVGFPGEKKTHFDKMLGFISKVKFDRMGAFTFFPEEGTVAFKMAGQVSELTKKKRLGALMNLQEEISFERQQLFVGKDLDVLIENVEREFGFAEGRSFREAPEVDGLIEVRNISDELKEGDVVKVLLTEAMPHDMVGEEVQK
ncbi:MAG: 30S ribosomal protein S12 methylthiotransferase RimO [Synergistaceae bacterium]|nr:30S ribosomal protein S12 methylthiotransferase RimO [Synergistaceae bacterium]